METPVSTASTPTPEALLGMLGKLKRTLTKNLSDQRRTSDDKGYIAAGNSRTRVTGDAPNLLRPSPGLEKLALSTGQSLHRLASPTAQTLQLESSAPPMDLDRPQGSSAQLLNPSQSLLEQSPEPPPAPLMQAQSTYPDLSAGSAVTTEDVKVTITPAALTPAKLECTVSTEKGAQASAKLAEPAQAGISTAPADGIGGSPITFSGSEPGGSKELAPLSEAESATVNQSTAGAESAGDAESASEAKSANETAEHAAQSVLIASSLQHGASNKQAPPASQLQQPAAPVPEGHSANLVDLSTVQSIHAESYQDWGASTGAGADVEGSSREARGPALPTTEEGLDSAMQELALEVSQLQPTGQASSGEDPARQGSYLQRHTSSLILKMTQDAANPPLPAVANLGASPHSQALSQAGTPHSATKPADARKTIKTMAASLFRAFDEGKLKDRGLALAQQQGAVMHQPAERPLEATLRTYRSSPPKRREAPSRPVRQSVSPARTSSYSLRKPSFRRSLSPNIGRQAPPLRQPEWDSSKPARPSPQRAQSAADQVTASGTPSDRRPSPHAACIPEGALHEVQHAQRAALGSGQPQSAHDLAEGATAPLPAASPALLAKPKVLVAASAMPSAAQGSSTADAPEVGSSTIPSMVSPPQAGVRLLGRGQLSPTPSPPRFRRLPSINLSDRPAWASSTSSRANASQPTTASPLRRTTGSRTMSVAPQRVSSRRSTAESTMAGISEATAPQSGSGSRPRADGSRAGHSQASVDSHADYLVDSQAHAHAQALQRLQQAAEDYNSSSPQVLVPAAVELAAALRQAAKRPGQPRLSLEALQLAGLKLKHEIGDGDGPSQSVPASPWPEWVSGAWGSPQAQTGGARLPANASANQEEDSNPATKDITPVAQAGKKNPQRVQRDPKVGVELSHGNGWSPVKQPESSASRGRAALVRRALAEAEAAAAKSPANQPTAGRSHNQARSSVSPPRVASSKSRTSATPPRASAKRSRVSATPPRSAVTPPVAPQQAESKTYSGSKGLLPNDLQAAPGQDRKLVKRPSLKGSQAPVASPKCDWQPTPASLQASQGPSEREVPILEGRQPVQRAKSPPTRGPSIQSRQREGALQAFGMPLSAQHTNVAWADRERVEPGLIQVSEDTEQPVESHHNMHAEHAETLSTGLHSNPSSASDHAQHAAATPPGLQAISNAEPHVVVTPLHSVTSVAALRQSFEQKSSPSVTSAGMVKPRNRLPLRKVSSKAAVFEDDGSPQQAALLWQQSLRGARSEEDVHGLDHAEHHTEHHAEHGQIKHDGIEPHTSVAAGSTLEPAPLYHTMSALIAQGPTSLLPQAAGVAAAGMPVRRGAEQGPGLSAGKYNGPALSDLGLAQLGNPRLTEAVLAAAENVRSSAEKLPVSHRLPVSRSVFDSDEGSLVSSDEQYDPNANNPQGSALQPLIEEATLALLPDRGMSPVSESAEDHTPSGSGRTRQSESAKPQGSAAQHAQHTPRADNVGRDEVYPWSSLGWATAPSWARVMCRLCPSPPPHFATLLTPHTLHTSLGLHSADAKTYTFDQVLASSCDQQQLAGQASGVVEAVLRGRNSVVLAVGQTGSGKTHSLLGDDPHDPQASSSASGTSSLLVEALFAEMQQQRVPSQVQSVYVTAFQIMNETIQDLLQAQQPDADSKQRLRRGSSMTGRHDVFVDKQKRTWVSNLAAIRISSAAEFQQILDLVSCHRHQSASSPGLSHLSHGPSSCVVTLLVTADISTASLQTFATQEGSASVVTQSRTQSLGAAAQSPTTRVCSKLTFVEVGGSTVPIQAVPVRTVSAGHSVAHHRQLSRSSTGISVATSYARHSSSGDRTLGLAAGLQGGRGSAAGARGSKPQDNTMRSVSEVVWAAAHGKGMPVPHRACKLTRYLQDTLCPSGRAVALVCINPSAEMQSSSIPVLTAAERMLSA